MNAQEKGSTKTGSSQPIPGTSKLKNLNEQRFRRMKINRDKPHDKGNKKDSHRRDTIRGKEIEFNQKEEL